MHRLEDNNEQNDCQFRRIPEADDKWPLTGTAAGQHSGKDMLQPVAQENAGKRKSDCKPGGCRRGVITYPRPFCSFTTA